METFPNTTINALHETTFIAGTYKEFTFHTFTSASVAIDLSSSGSTIIWHLCPYDNQSTSVISKTITGSNGYFTVPLYPFETEKLSGKYIQKPMLVDTTYNYRLAQGIINIIPAIRNPRIEILNPISAWLSGNIPSANCVAAYQAMGASSLENSYVNLANSGTHDILLELEGMLVSGAGTSAANGVYTKRLVPSSRPEYDGLDGNLIKWDTSLLFWYIKQGATAKYYSEDNVATPNLCTTWLKAGTGGNPVPAVTSLSLTGDAPSWNSSDGWIFDGEANHLLTDIVPALDNSWSVITMFSKASTPSSGYGTLFGSYKTAGYVFTINLRYAQDKIGYFNFKGGDSLEVSPNIPAGIIGFAGNTAYRNGVKETSSMPLTTEGTALPMFIGALNNNNTPFFFLKGNIQYMFIYDITLNEYQYLSVVNAIKKRV